MCVGGDVVKPSMRDRHSPNNLPVKMLEMRIHLLVFVIVLVAVSSARIYAQNAPENLIEKAGVSISVFVTDAHRNPVSAVSDGDLSIEDEHKPPHDQHRRGG